MRLNKAVSIVNDLEKAKKMGFSSIDFVQIYEHGIPLVNIQNQLTFFKNGIFKVVLVEAAKGFKGILKLSETIFNKKQIFLMPINQL